MSNRRKLRGKDWAPLSRRLSAITDDQETRLAEEINTISPGFLDQLQAATADSTRTNAAFRRAAMAQNPGTSGEIDSRNVPQHILHQVKGLYIRVITELAAGTRRHCRHITPDAPIPAVACVHADWIYCRACLTRNATPPELSEREEHTCDLCGTYKPEQTMNGLYPQVGPVLLIIGICPACSDRLPVSTP